MGYRKVIDGITLDGELYALAEAAVTRNADGRISLDDTKGLFELVIDEGLYTKVEEDTVDYMLRNMRWRPEAREWFMSELAAWQVREMKSTPMSPEEISKEHFVKHDILTEEFDRVSREVELRAATMKTFDDHDEIALIVRLADGRRIKVKSRFIELEDDFVELFGGCVIPLKAIERVEF